MVLLMLGANYYKGINFMKNIIVISILSLIISACSFVSEKVGQADIAVHNVDEKMHKVDKTMHDVISPKPEQKSKNN